MKAVSITLALALWGGILIAAAGAETQPRPSFLDQPAEVVVPADYDPSVAYPVYVFLPYTGGRAIDFYSRMLDFIERDNALVVLPSGRPRSVDYLPDFMSFVRWYEERLLTDLARIERQYSVDSDRIVVAGFSLGGDLGWALALRNPDRFAGAVMAGTRASYPAPRGSVETLNRRGFRGAFIIGRSELAARAEGIERAESLLRGGGVETRFRTVEGGHTYGSASEVVEALYWVLDTNGTEMRAPTAAGAGRSSEGRRPREQARDGGIAARAGRQDADTDDRLDTEPENDPQGTPGNDAFEFPATDFLVALDLDGDWGEVVESDASGYDVAFTSEKGPMRIRMYASFGEPVPPQEHLEQFVDQLPFTRDVEFYTIERWDSYQEEYVDRPLVTGVSQGRRFIARAWWPDYYPVLAVVSVPERLEDEYMAEMRGILE